MWFFTKIWRILHSLFNLFFVIFFFKKKPLPAFHRQYKVEVSLTLIFSYYSTLYQIKSKQSAVQCSTTFPTNEKKI
jgi:hypothetical protein